MSYSRILVPTDFSGPAREATDSALDLAHAFGASIDLLHVIQDPVVYIPALGGYMPQPRDLEDFSEAALAEWIDPDVLENVEVRRHWVHGHPAAEIMEFARKHYSDLIVMGTHGRGMLSHMLIGSVAERVVRRAPCPVLTVHPTSAVEDTHNSAVAVAEGS